MRCPHPPSRSTLSWKVLPLVAWLAASGFGASGQVFLPGDVASLSTAEGFLVSRSIDLTAGVVAGLPGEVRFQMAFGTQESASAGGLHDSLTATLATTDDSLFAAVATMDVFGLTLAPSLTGGVALEAASISLSPITAPMTLPAGYPTTLGYAVTLPVPAAFSGKDLRLYFDLVTGDADATASEGRVQVPIVAVPEPAAWWLLTVLPLWAAGRCWHRGGRLPAAAAAGEHGKHGESGSSRG